MKIGINDWLKTTLGVSQVVSNLIAFGIVIFVVLIVWFVIKKIVIALIPKVTAKTATLWDDIIFNKRMVNSLATLIPALIVDQFIPVIFKQSTAFLPFLLEATDVLIIIVSVWILNSFFSSINIILSEKQRYKDNESIAYTAMHVELSEASRGTLGPLEPFPESACTGASMYAQGSHDDTDVAASREAAQEHRATPRADHAIADGR